MYLIYYFILLLNICLLLFVFVNGNDKCSEGPYFVSLVYNPWNLLDGLGQSSLRMMSELLICEYFMLKCIYNPLWFTSAHNTSFSQLFHYQNYLNNDCTIDDISKLRYNYPKNKDIVEFLNISDISFEFMEKLKYVPNLNINYSENYPIGDNMFANSAEYNESIDYFRKTHDETHNFLLKLCSGQKVDKKEIFLLSNDSVIKQIAIHLQSSTFNRKKTIIQLFRSYRSLEPVRLDCLQELHSSEKANTENSFHSSFWTKKESDLYNKINRYILPKDCIVISYLFRWGDSFYDHKKVDHRHQSNGPLKEGIMILKRILLYSDISILKKYIDQGGCYKIYFHSEYSKKEIGASYSFEDNRRKEKDNTIFHKLASAFPKNVVELRLNPHNHSFDADIIASSDILVIGKSSFHKFMAHVSYHLSLKIYYGHLDDRSIKSAISWDNLLSNNNRSIHEINMIACKFSKYRQMNEIVRLCSHFKIIN